MKFGKINLLEVLIQQDVLHQNMFYTKVLHLGSL